MPKSHSLLPPAAGVAQVAITNAGAVVVNAYYAGGTNIYVYLCGVRFSLDS
jgi:hypothetical protein